MSEELMICGIDPGLDGGLVFLYGRKVAHREVMPILTLPRKRNVKGKSKTVNCRMIDETAVVEMIRAANPDHVYIERSQAMTKRGVKQGVTGVFNYGYGFGLLVGIVAGLLIPRTLVPPRTWQCKMLKDMPKVNTKKAASVLVPRFWPKTDWRGTLNCHTPHEGLCDAALIARYGQMYGNKTDG